MTLVRIITAKQFQEIDLDNLGNHFTVEGNEPVIANKLEHLSAESQEGDIFYIYVECDSINKDSTEFSNNEHPLEKEVITNQNSPIQILEILDDCFNCVAENIEGNTGTRVHEWVNQI